jgi:hypothetical protein
MPLQIFFPGSELLKVLSERGVVFFVPESLEPLVGKVSDKAAWLANRQKRQKELLELMERRPEILRIVYKLSDFVIKDRTAFKIKCSRGSDDHDAIGWESNHRNDKLQDFKLSRMKRKISEEDLKNILKHFFLAAPELFIIDYREDGKKFYIEPEAEDCLYHLAQDQGRLDELYAGLNQSDPIFLEPWMKLLG